VQIPSIFHGDYRTVRKNVRELARAFVEGQEVISLTHSTLDPEEVPGWLVLDEPRVQLKSGEHFFLGTLGSAISSLMSKRAHDRTPWRRFHDWGFADSGGLLTILGQEATSYLYSDRAQQIRLLEAAIRFWPDLSAVGARYVARVTARPSGIWDFPNGITGSVTLLSERRWTRQPLPPGGLSELVRALGLPVTTHSLGDDGAKLGGG